ncbi:MAG: DNA mismatch repair protein MutS [Treponema sp.]|nr:DNA mismatch repair protein MutS [Treponema sp.]
MSAAQTSPMLDQYRRIKKEQKGNILFFRLGDFYEMFADDALEVSSLLNLTLTSRNGLPMCGVPYHAARVYIARLLKLGKKIAICEQLTQPSKGQKIIERQVVEIITPGTTVDEDFLDKGSANYLACLSAAQNTLSFSYIDLSTGEFFATFFPLRDSSEMLRQELERLQIREMLIQESILEEYPDIASAIHERSGLVLNRWADWLFDPQAAEKRLIKQFRLANLKSFGLEEGNPVIISAGALLDYLDTTAKAVIPHIRTINIYNDNDFVGIDESSQRNLELLRNIRDGDTRFSLLEVMNETRCAMGLRLLKRRMLHPLRNINKIEARLNLVEALFRDQGLLSRLRDSLGKTPDLERLSSRLAMDKAHGRDMLAIKNALDIFFEVSELTKELRLHEENEDGDKSETEENSTDGFEKLIEIGKLLEKSISEEPSILLSEGNLIKDGYSPDLDQLKLLKNSGRQLLEEYLETERIATGISSLKIRYNRLIGYFFEVTKAHLEKVPSHFIRRQGIVGGERFTSNRLAELESDINGASEKIVELERKIFLEIRQEAKSVLSELACAAHRIAELDTAQSLAKAAAIRGWIRPMLDESNILEIYEGRHPVVEAHISRGEYIPNDILMNTGDPPGNKFSFVLITGPNMAGKSTYLRSAALITLMAQMGSFVPAREARIGICDRIYCRVGASDNLARGESTFLVEMNETAYILNTATEKSLVIMDEVGRGTGTNDGLSIAWAVSEELLNMVKCRTLFATHYHELSLLSHQRIVNRSMEVLEQDGKIIFLRKLRDGPTEESYGIHVARLAGLSEHVLGRAAQLMRQLKEKDSGIGENLPASGDTDTVNQFGEQVNGNVLRNDNNTRLSAEFLRLLQSFDLDLMTPLEALKLLGEWKKKITAADLAPIIPVKNQVKTNRSKPKENPTLSLFD